MHRRITTSLVLLVACSNSRAPQQVATGSGGKDASAIADATAPRGIALPISCGAATQVTFDRALGLLHNMMYSQARSELETAVAANPTCAMLQWGIAMTWFWPLWSGQPTRDALKAGSDAVSRARALSAEPHEQAYVAAVASYYQDWETTDTKTRLRNWEIGQRALAERYPDDVEAQSFWALALLATADRYDKTYARQRQAAALLQELLKIRPEHPGLLHNLVHAMDNPAHSHHALKVADEYDDVAPRAPHALHMPSHIYVRIGNWPEVVSSNLRSAQAAREQPAPGGKVSRDLLHAVDYLVYAYLQTADDARAKETLVEIDPATAYEQESGPAAYALAAAPARFAIERGDWKAAATLPVRHIPYAWDKFPWAEAVTHAARGFGAARLGDVKGANAAMAELDRLEPLVESAWWRDRIEIDREAIAAWVAYKRGDRKRAVEIAAAAAKRELAAGKEAVEPGHVIHAAEQYGELLLQLGKHAEAIAAFEAALADSPKRFNSLLGLADALQRAKRTAEARARYTELVSATTEGSTRPGYLRAKAAVAAPSSK